MSTYESDDLAYDYDEDDFCDDCGQEWVGCDCLDEPEDDGQPSFMDEHDSSMASVGWGTDEDYGFYGDDFE